MRLEKVFFPVGMEFGPPGTRAIRQRVVPVPQAKPGGNRPQQTGEGSVKMREKSIVVSVLTAAVVALLVGGIAISRRRRVAPRLVVA